MPGAIIKVISRNPSYEPFTVAISELENPDGFAVIRAIAKKIVALRPDFQPDKGVQTLRKRSVNDL